MIHRPQPIRLARRYCLMLAAGALLYALMYAPLADAEEGPVIQVEVSSVRSPGTLPYKLAYRLLQAVARTGSPPRVTAQIRVVDSANQLPTRPLKLRLLGPNTDQLIAISAQGEISLPLDEAAFNDDAEIVSNRKKGAMGVSVSLLPQFSMMPVRYRDLVATIEDARKVRDEFLPWYLRLMLPTANSILVCFPAAGQAVKLHAVTDIERNADRIDTADELTLHCARFGANETEIAADAELIVPPGVSYRFGT